MTAVPDYLDPGAADADLASHDTFAAGIPHATLRRLRDTDPVAWIPEHDGGRGFWAVTRYADVLKVSHDVETFTSSRGIRLEEMSDDETAARRTMMELDPPDHTRLRRLVNRGFTRRAVDAYESAIRQLAVLVIEEALSKGRFDFVHDVARQLPMRMLGRLLGVPDADGDRLVGLGDALLANADPEFTDHPVDLTDTDEFRLMPFRSPAAIELFRYADAIARDRRAHPRDDILTQLLAPTIDGEPLTELEFKNFFTLMVAAGNDTTRYTITSGLWHLIHNPDQLDRWRSDPSISATATEEVLRAGSVTMHFRRTATRDTELGGKQIKAGDKVVMWYLSADYDERQFPEPFLFDLTRTPNDHVAFGRNGPHLCLGAWLARLEIRVTFEELLPRLGSIAIDGRIERLRSNFISGIKHLPVVVL